MNMIMHGDGHGGVHHHNGFINVNGIFEGRFDLILTNPPFGANVEPSDHVTGRRREDHATTHTGATPTTYGPAIQGSPSRAQAAEGKPIASLYRASEARAMGQQDREGQDRNPLHRTLPGNCSSRRPHRRSCCRRASSTIRPWPTSASSAKTVAYILAVVSLPPETFNSSGASVKASLLFLGKYTNEESARLRRKIAAVVEVETKYRDEVTVKQRVGWRLKSKQRKKSKRRARTRRRGENWPVSGRHDG